MPALEKALLQEISSDARPRPLGPALPVQFNPATLRLALSNQIEGGRSLGRQHRQYLGSSSTVLSLELVFDSADEGSSAQPLSVRDKTARVERFLVPRGDGDQQAVPKLRFSWGDLVFDGVVESLGLDFDHFASDGTPLRAKATLSIREQDPQYQLLQRGPGARKGLGASLPGGGGVGLGLSAGLSVGLSAGVGLSADLNLSGELNAGVDLSAGTQVGVALGGETATDFAARMGLDPSAWRGLGADLGNGLELQAGAEVRFDTSLASGAGVGSAAGVEAGASDGARDGNSLQQALAVAGGNSAGSDRGTNQQARLALAAQGGLQGSLDAIAARRTESEAAAQRLAFTPAGGTVAASVPRESAKARTRPDPRSLSYGRGVPLRARPQLDPKEEP